MRVEIAKKTDLAKVLSWFEDASALCMWGGPALTFPPVLDRILTEIQWPLARSFTLYEKESIIGFVQVLERYGFNHISRLTIAPEQRCRGLGRKLMHHVLTLASCCGRDFSLFVYDDNIKARTLYEHLGFVDHPYPSEQAPIEGCRFMVRKG